MAIDVLPGVRQATTAEIAVVGILSAGAFLGCLIYGVKEDHPWIGLIAGMVASGVVSSTAFAILGASPYDAMLNEIANAPQTVVTPEGVRRV